MRLFYFFILVVVIAAVAIFAWQNDDTITLRYLDRSMTQPLPLLIAVVYVLGMLSGWTVVGFLKRSLQRVTERRAS